MNTALLDAFLADIVAHPADDTPRLIFADWLDDQGDGDRAEFIRIQIEKESLAAKLPRTEEIDARCRVLLDRHRTAWSAGMDALTESATFRRGFIAQVRVTVKGFLENAASILQRCPIEEMDLTFTGEQVADLVDRPELQRVTRFTATSLGDSHVETLASSPYLGRILHIYFHSCGLTEAGARSLVRMPLAHLQTMNLGANELGDGGAALLFGHPELGCLRELGLGANGLYLPSAQAMVQAPALGGLRKVNLGANYLDNAAITLLANAENLKDIEDLDVRYNEFGNPGGEALLRSPYLQKITHLNVNRNALDQVMINALQARFGTALEP